MASPTTTPTTAAATASAEITSTSSIEMDEQQPQSTTGATATTMCGEIIEIPDTPPDTPPPDVGGYDVLLLHSIPAKYKCPICSMLMRDALQTYRGEMACESCYHHAKG